MNRIHSLAVLGAAGAVMLSATSLQAQVAELTVTSPAFEEEGAIPLRNSAYGDNLSPELNWTGAPDGTAQFALILVDPDVPMPNGFVHWVIYNIPGSATGLPEGIPADASTVSDPASIAGAAQGLMGMRNPGYFGPRPPAGQGAHHYAFTVYALDEALDLEPGLNREAILEAIEGHVIGEGTLTGVYEAD